MLGPRSFVILGFFVAACGGATTASVPNEAPSDPGSRAPAPNKEPAGSVPTKRCNVDDPFGAMRPIEGVRSPLYEERVSLSDDELTIVFRRVTTQYTIWSAHRATRDEPFGAPRVELDGLEGSDPTISSDGLTLYYVGQSAHDGVDSFDIFRTQRANTSEVFRPGTPLKAVNTAHLEERPFVRGNELWFTSARSGGMQLFRSTIDKNDVGAPVLASELTLGDRDDGPVLSADGLVLYFTHGSDDGEYVPSVATRKTTAEPFGPARRLDELVRPSSVTTPSWISSDLCRLYVIGDGGGGGYPALDILVAERKPR
jgi:hypothetical protein